MYRIIRINIIIIIYYHHWNYYHRLYSSRSVQFPLAIVYKQIIIIILSIFRERYRVNTTDSRFYTVNSKLLFFGIIIFIFSIAYFFIYFFIRLGNIMACSGNGKKNVRIFPPVVFPKPYYFDRSNVFLFYISSLWDLRAHFD